MPGKDIFLSYAGEDRSRIVPLARALEGTGWTVFWDRKIPTGKQWAEVLESEITTCRSVVVVWSQASVSSRWVRKEASEGDRRGVLLPVRIDDVEPPFEYREIQAADLIGWEGGAAATGFEGLVEDLALVLGRPPRQAGAGEAEPRRAEGEARPPVEEAARKAKEGGEARRFRRPSTRTLLASLGLAAGGGVLLAVVLLLVNPTPGPTPGLTPEPANGVYTIQGKNRRYLSYYPNNFQIMMADWQNDVSQRWVLERVSGNDYRIQNKDLQNKNLTVRCLTPPGRKPVFATAAQGDCKSQLWVLTKVRDGVYYIQQKSNERCLTALEPSPYPWVGTRSGPCDKKQEWVLAPAP